MSCVEEMSYDEDTISAKDQKRFQEKATVSRPAVVALIKFRRHLHIHHFRALFSFS